MSYFKKYFVYYFCYKFPIFFCFYIAVISILFTSAVAAMSELRRDMLNFVVRVYEDRTTYSLPGLRPPTPIHEIKAGWLPDGYALADERTTPMSRTNLYQTDGGKEIEIYVTDMSGAGISVDTEDNNNGQLVENPTVYSLTVKY